MRTSSVASTQLVPPVLIVCTDEAVVEKLVRELAGRCYQPLVGRPGWSWNATLAWARPVAAVVDTHHPAVRSDDFLEASYDLEVGLVVFGGPADVLASPSGSRGDIASVPTDDAQLIGGAVDAAVRRRSAQIP